MATRGLAAPPYTNEFYAIAAKMAVQPSSSYASAYDTMIRALKTADVWNKFDLFYWLAAETAQQAGLNWMNPGVNTLSPVNSPTFTAGQGYNSDGSTSYLDTLTVAAGLVRLIQNSAHLGAWKRAVVGAGRSMWGAGTVADFLRISSTINVAGRINSASTTNAPLNNIRHAVLTRRDASNHFVYGDGAGEITAAVASVAVSTGNFVILKDSSGAFEDGQVVCAHLGSQISAANVLAIYNAINACRTTIGA